MAMQQIKLVQEQNIAILILDSPDKKLNIINPAMLEEISVLYDNINRNDSIKAILLISAKDDNFIAGADIHAFEKMTGQEARALSEQAHALLNKIALSRKPYFAAIHGACLGGGLEVALACHYRVATCESLFGSPEVLLGILPAAGGTARLPRLIGMKSALTLLLSGKRIGTKEAYALGLVDLVVRTHEELKASTLGFIHQILLQKKPKKRKRLHLWSLFSLLLAKRITRKKTQGHYPAPLAIIDTIKTGVIKGFEAGLKKESQEFGKLIQSLVSKNLVRLFFAQKARQKTILKSKDSQTNVIGVIGSGLMGSGIATVSLLHGQRVYINDSDPRALARAQAHIWHEIEHRVSKKRIFPSESRRFISNLTTTDDFQRFSYCNIIIEAIFEDLGVKRKLLERCESVMNETCIFASNTSSIPIAEIAQNSSIKDRIIGMHYFSPVEKMPLLEIIKTNNTSANTLEKAITIGALQGKTIIIVNDSPGFYTTRIVAALFDEACALLLEGYEPKDIDHQLISLGFPMGPLALMDQVGLDVGFHVSEVLEKRLGNRLISVDLGIYKSMIDAHLLGRKTKRGFYLYKNHKKTINPMIEDIIEPYKKNLSKSYKNANLAERMLLRMVNEAAYCLAEKVITTPEDGDVGAVFGVGFPPYLGGPFQYIKEQGETSISQRLAKLSEIYGQRFSKKW